MIIDFNDFTLFDPNNDNLKEDMKKNIVSFGKGVSSSIKTTLLIGGSAVLLLILSIAKKR